MAFDIQAARDEGYTDEEIRQYLASKGEPIPAELSPQPAVQPMPAAAPNAPPDQVVDRSAEQNTTLGAGALMTAAAVGGPVLLYKGGKAIANAIRGPVEPTPQVQPGATQRTLSTLTGGANRMSVPAPSMNPPTASPSYTAPSAAAAEATQMTAARNIVQKLALDKVLKGAGAAGGLAALGAGLFYTSPEEVAILKEAERRKKAGLQ